VSHRFVIVLVLLIVAGTLNSGPSPPARAQTQSTEKPTLKKFGSSLKRFKWDPSKQAAIETEDEEEAAAKDVVRIRTELVVCDVMVTDKQGRIVSGLTSNDFVVTEDGQPQQITHFSPGSDVSVGRSIVLIIDHSRSLLPYLNTTVDASKVLVDKLGPRDRMAIVTDDVALLADFTKDKARLKKALESLRLKALSVPGHSDQFSALLATARELFDQEDIRPVIIFQTDGDQVIFLQPPDPVEVLAVSQRRSRVKPYSLDDVYTAIEKARATVYTIIPGLRLIGMSQTEQLSRVRIEFERARLANPLWPDDLNRPWRPSNKDLADALRSRLQGQLAASGVAKLTGGWATFLEEPEQAATIYSSILSDLNDRYVVGYYPTNKVHDGKRRKLLVEVRKKPEYTIWSRKSYLAPESEWRD
jgi:VWFA-related protein